MSITINIYSENCFTDSQEDVQGYLDDLQSEVDKLYPTHNIEVKFVIDTGYCGMIDGVEEDEQLEEELHSVAVWV